MKEFIFTTMQGLKVTLDQFKILGNSVMCHIHTPYINDREVFIAKKNLLEILLNTDLIYGIEVVEKKGLNFLDLFMVQKSSIR